MHRVLFPFFNQFEARYSRTMMRLLARAFGQQAAIGWMSHFPLRRRTKARLLWLHEYLSKNYNRQAADCFVKSYLCARPRAKDYRILLCETGPSQISSAALKAMLPEIAASARGKAARLTGLIMALLERDDADLIEVALSGLNETSSDLSVSSAIRALFLRPLGSQASLSRRTNVDPATIRPRPCHNRLLLIDGQLSLSVLKYLAHGAERLTIMRYGDLYGHIDLTAVRKELPAVEIAIEHARTRVDRFRRRYFELHQASFEVANALGTAFVEANPWVLDEVSSFNAARHDFILGVADFLFFKMLRMDGTLKAVLDPTFDSVIIAFADNFELFRLCAASRELNDDPRIQACCWHSGRAQSKFEMRQLEVAKAWAAATPRFHVERELESSTEPPIVAAPNAVRSYLRKATRLRRTRSGNHKEGRRSVAMVANEGRAYGYNAVQIACALQDQFNVDVVWTQGKEKSFDENVSRAGNDPVLCQWKRDETLLPGLVNVAPVAPDRRANAAIRASTMTAFARPVHDLLARWKNDPAIANTIDCVVTSGLAELMLRQVGQIAMAEKLFTTNQYDAVAISPARAPSNAVFAGVARTSGIPSLTVETHCLNAAYCRYTTITTDYAAVYSDHYIREYEQHFGIDAARLRPFGSPRILRPSGYESEGERIRARERIGFTLNDPPIIAVPTQPMPPALILGVWRMIIRAAKDLDRPIRVLLKTHPEEGQGHVERYRQIISEENAADICSVVEVDIKDLLMASNLVLTCYSVTALEAVVLERNVAIVSQPGVNYPTAYDQIIGVPLCCTSDDTLEAIRAALDLGPEATSGAEVFKAAHPYLFDNSTFERLRQVVEEIVERGPVGIRRRDELPQSTFVTAPFQEYMI
jgi:hypothetical protein